MDEEKAPNEVLTLSRRKSASDYAVKLFSALAPAKDVHALNKCRTRLCAEIETADPELLPTLANSLCKVIELGARFYGLPGVPKAQATKPGDNAKPILPMD